MIIDSGREVYQVPGKPMVRTVLFDQAGLMVYSTPNSQDFVYVESQIGKKGTRVQKIKRSRLGKQFTFKGPGVSC